MTPVLTTEVFFVVYLSVEKAFLFHHQHSKNTSRLSSLGISELLAGRGRIVFENLRVLVVDDDRSLLQVLLTLLEVEGCNVEAADSPFTAMGVVRQQKFDLILADLRMPRMDGLQFIRSAKLFSPDAHFTVMTAYPTDDSKKAAAEQGIDNYLYKPFKLEELKDILASAQQRANAS